MPRLPSLKTVEKMKSGKKARRDRELRNWPADAVERRPTKSLIPNARNSRKHSAEQIEQIAAAMREFGWTNPVLVDESSGIIAGHGRVLAAELLGYDEVPVMVARGWSEEQKRAYIIADNKLALNASWDDDMLASELRDLKELGYGIDVIGFDAVELSELLEPPAETKTEPPHEYTDSEHRLLNEAWRALLPIWRETITKLRAGKPPANFARELLPVHFLRARFLGKDIPRNAAIAYCPHRLSVAGDKGSLLDLFSQNEYSDELIRSIRWAAQERPDVDRMFSLLAVHGMRAPADFPAALARDLIDEFAPAGAAVLDPCHGWGGRLIGFLLSKHGKSYHGFDVDPQTNAGVAAIAADLQPYAATKRAVKLQLERFERSRLKPNAYDFALTSPPYFDVEKYDGEHSSWRVHDTFNKWVAGFYRPLLQLVARALKRGGTFALQVGNQSYPLVDLAQEFAPEYGFAVLEVRGTGMINNQAKTAEEDGECIVVLRREK